MSDTQNVIDRLKLSGPYSASDILSRVTEYIPTGCYALDLAIGGGQTRLGIPVGRMTEIFGESSTGKTLLGVHALAMTQAIGGIAVFINTECTMADNVLANIGVDLDSLIQATPDTVEEVYAIMTEVMETRRKEAPDKLITIVWDSVAATTTKEELDKVKKDGLNSRSSMASTARLLSQMCRCIKTDIARDRVAMVFINQVRENVGVMFGEDFTTSGGKAVGFHASLRIQVSRKTIMKDVTDGGTPKGIDVKALIYKNKLARPFAWCEIPMMFEYGIDDATAMFWKLKQDGYMVARGPWHYMQLDKEEIKVQQAGWADLYNERGEEIRQWFYERTV